MPHFYLKVHLEMKKIIIMIASVLLVSLTVNAQQSVQITPEANAIPRSVEYVTTFKSKGLSMQAPKGWLFMSPSEVRKKTGGAMQIATNTIFFVVNESDFDSNINVQYIGDASSDAPTVKAAIRLLRQMQRQVEPMMRQQFSEFRKVKSEIINFSGGVALDFVFTSVRGNTLMKQKQIIVISNKKAFTITCTAKESVFGDYFFTGFEPILRSIKIR